MKKLSLFSIVTLLLLSSVKIHAQWSNHLITSDLPVTSSPDHYSSSSDAHILPDAVTSNGNNSNSNFQQNSVFSIYSHNRISQEIPEAGAWLIAKDINGQTTLSRRIRVDGHLLRVFSLQYEGDTDEELLVFTGSVLIREGYEAGSQSFSHRMVYGTYNLATDQVRMNHVNQVYGNNSFIVSSQGVGVREVRQLGDNTYMAIGQTGDVDNGDISSEIPAEWWTPNAISGAIYPIGIIFTVGGSGEVYDKHIEIVDLKFKPHSLSKSVDNVRSNGASVYVGGMRILENPISTCVYDPNKPWQHCQTLVAAAAYTFDATLQGGNYDIEVDNGMYLTMDEYSHFGVGDPDLRFEIMVNDDDYPDSRSVILGGSTKEGQVSFGLKLGLMFFDFDIDLSSGAYTLDKEVKYDLINSDDVYTQIQQILPNHGNGEFDVIFKIDDWQNTWGQIGRNSIGILSLPKDNIVLSSLPFKSIYNDDTPSAPIPLGGQMSYNHPVNIADVNNVTGIKVFNEGGEEAFTYLLADGSNRSTLYARAHFDGGMGNEFSCEDNGTANGSNPNVTSYADGHQSSKKTPDTKEIDGRVEEISVGDWECGDYPYTTREFGRLRSLTNDTPSSLDINFVDRNSYKLNLQDETVMNYQLYNISGQKVKSVLNTDKVLSVNDLSSGIYILNIQTDKKFYSEKLIIQ